MQTAIFALFLANILLGTALVVALLLRQERRHLAALEAENERRIEERRRR
ncbi:MAG: hypothetical protein AAFP13_03310 [Pseudomonadota bacterium]